MTGTITSATYHSRIKRDTSGFTKFTGRNVKVGQRRVFVYPNFGTPDGYPDYTAHRFHIVTVVGQADDASDQGERMFKIEASDGWRGSAWASELFPLPRGHR